MQVVRRFGRIHRADRRDEGHRIRAAKSSRTFRYWPSLWHGDQGSTPHCVGFAWAHWLACSPRPAYLDGHGIYSLCLFLDEWPGEADEGTSVRAGAQIAQRVGLIGEYQWARSKAALIYTVLELGPVVCGTDWYSGMSNPDAHNVISVSGDYEGGHAWLLDGINLQTGLARCRCAWLNHDGTPWGAAGRVWLPIDDAWRLISNEGEACLGVKRNVREH